jgi:hypothetical protein
MRWTSRGAHVVLQLRAAALTNNRWNAFWRKISLYGVMIEADCTASSSTSFGNHTRQTFWTIFDGDLPRMSNEMVQSFQRGLQKILVRIIGDAEQWQIGVRRPRSRMSTNVDRDFRGFLFRPQCLT